MSGASAEQGTVLVTGANGHLGRRLCQRLAGLRPVRALVRSQRAADTLAELPGPARPEIVQLAYGDAEAMARAAEGCRHAVHLVGILKEGARSSYREAHEESAGALATAADRCGLARLVYPSILGSHPEAANSCLASKGRAEEILLTAKTPALVLRVPMVLGEGDLASRALRKQALAPWVAVTRGGRSLEQPIYAGDVVEAIAAGLERPGLDDLALDLAGPESLPRRGLLARVAALHGRRVRIVPVPRALVFGVAAVLERASADPPVTRAMLDVLEHDDAVDPREAAARLGIELTSLDETLRRCVGPEAPA